MSITSAKYVANELNPSENKGVQATINDQSWYIPLDPNNSDYQAILEWVAEGNTIQEAD